MAELVALVLEPGLAVVELEAGGDDDGRVVGGHRRFERRQRTGRPLGGPVGALLERQQVLLAQDDAWLLCRRPGWHDAVDTGVSDGLPQVLMGMDRGLDQRLVHGAFPAEEIDLTVEVLVGERGDRLAQVVE
jgi:hypothetical protein